MARWGKTILLVVTGVLGLCGFVTLERCKASLTTTSGARAASTVAAGMRR